MPNNSSRIPWVLLGGALGFVLSAGMFMSQALPGVHRGLPIFAPPDMSILLVALGFITLWIVLIAVAIRWLFNPRGQQHGRLADLPADFDDWHRRAHAQMDREATARADGAQS